MKQRDTRSGEREDESEDLALKVNNTTVANRWDNKNKVCVQK